MVGSVAGDLPEQVKNNQSVNLAAGNGGQKMSQYSWFTVYDDSPISFSYKLHDKLYLYVYRFYSTFLHTRYDQKDILLNVHTIHLGWKNIY